MTWVLTSVYCYDGNRVSHVWTAWELPSGVWCIDGPNFYRVYAYGDRRAAWKRIDEVEHHTYLNCGCEREYDGDICERHAEEILKEHYGQPA